MRFALLFLFLLACSSDSDSTDADATTGKGQKKKKRKKQEQIGAEDTGWTGEGPRVVELRVEPDMPTSTDILKVRKQVQQPPGSRVKARLQWMKNGSPLKGQVTQNLMSENFKKGDRLSVVLSFPETGGKKFKDHVSNEVIIGDTRPEIEIARNKDIFSAQISALFSEGRPMPIKASDIDGDDLVFRLANEPKGLQIRKTGKQSAELTWDRTAEFEPKEYRIKIIADDKELTAEWEFGATLWDNGVIENPEEGFTAEEEEKAVERADVNDAPIEGWKAEPEEEDPGPIEGWTDEPIEGIEHDEEDAETKD